MFFNLKILDYDRIMKFVEITLNFSDVPIPKVPSFGGIGEGMEDKLLSEAVNKIIQKAGLPKGIDADVEVQGDNVSATLKIPIDFLEKITQQGGNVTVTNVAIADE